jgi:hypothetical protein
MNDNNNSAEISIRGRGDRVTIIAKNFAPGTSISDITSVMAPYQSQCLLDSRMLSTSPIMAELVFGDRNAAESVVAKFNNKLADGRVLQVYFQQQQQQQQNQQTRQPAANQRQQPRHNKYNNDKTNNPDEMDVESSRSIDARVPRGQNQPNQARSRAPQFEDGKYGFTNKADRNGRSSNSRNNNNNRNRGQYGEFASDALMRDDQSTRRSNF